MIIPCLVPLKDGHILQPEFFAGLLHQSQQVAVLPISRPAMPAGKYASQTVVRNRLFSLAEGLECAFVAMIDCDNILTDPNALSEAVIALSDCNDLKVVHLRTKAQYTPGHFDIGAMVFKREIVQHVTFVCDNPQECNCEAFGKQIARAGWRQAWLNDNLQGRHLSYVKE